MADTATVQFDCLSVPYRVIIDQLPDQSLRYRSWLANADITSKPDLTLQNGTLELSGSSSYPISNYTFKNHSYSYEIEVPTASDGITLGTLKVLKNGNRIKSWGCTKPGKS